MLKFLQKIDSSSNASTGPRRPGSQSKKWNGRRAFAAENAPPKGNEAHVCETLSETGEDLTEQDVQLAHTVRAVTKTRRVLKLGLISQSHLGYPRHIDALVDTGAESSIVSLALAKELGV